MAAPDGGWKRFRRDLSGNVAVMAALAFPIYVGLAALAVDVGMLYLERREAQALTDLAAITAAANLDKADKAALMVFGDNGISGAVLADQQHLDDAVPRVKTTTGHYVPDPALDPDARFTPDAEPVNAVRVTFQKKGTLYFAGSFMDPPTITTEAVASRPVEAAFSVGSRLLSLNDGILNALLGRLLGANVGLRVMDYEALVDADVSLLSFLDGLATELHLTAGTYKDVLGTEVSVGRIVRVLADISNRDRRAGLVLKQLSDVLPLSTGLKLPLSHLIGLGSLGGVALGQADSGMDVSVGVMQLLWAAAAIGNGSNQVKLDTGVNLPGLLDVSVDLAIGEPPQGTPFFAIGEPGTLVRTAQTRLRVNVSVGGPGGLLGASINLPLYVEVAYAEAKLKSVSCPAGPGSGTVKIDARPGVAELWIGEVSPADLSRFGSSAPVQPAKLIQMPIVKVTALVHVGIGNQKYTSLSFSGNDIDRKVVKSVSTRNVTQSLTQTLLGNLDLTVKLDLGLISIGLVIPSTGVIETTVKTLLQGVTAPIDALLYNLLSVLGVRIGEADIRVHGLSCGRPVLVN